MRPTSWLIADRAGTASWHCAESSQATTDTSAGTPSPRSASASSAARAITSLSQMIAVGPPSCSTSSPVAARPDSYE